MKAAAHFFDGWECGVFKNREAILMLHPVEAVFANPVVFIERAETLVKPVLSESIIDCRPTELAMVVIPSGAHFPPRAAHELSIRQIGFLQVSAPVRAFRHCSCFHHIARPN